nr:immunoglobulin heavy chain junction region [Macaca mulatta]MOW22114.1 immunoglobulin heavy chain junction region [Macaca mulatta]
CAVGPLSNFDYW